MPNKTIWVIDDDPGIRYVLEEYLKSQGFNVSTFSSGSDFLKAFETTSIGPSPDVIMADIRLEGENGLDLMHAVGKENPELPVIIMTAYSDLQAAVSAFQGGAFEFLAKPFDLAEVKRLIEKTDRAKPEAMTGAHSEAGALGGVMIGQSAAFQELIRILGRLSNTDIPVLITGETGSGKELIARALHQTSSRATGPFVAINMAAISNELLESELFGHERGAFPGADQRYLGRFEQARNGTLFLDEIGDMPVQLQTRLLRVLAEGEYYRLGGRDLITASARIITATNQNLEQLVERGKFRADLYHRLKVISLNIPPLRNRREDVPQLVDHFLEKAASEFKVSRKTAQTSLVDHLTNLDWPGNVRELKNLCQSMAVLSPADVLGLDDLPAEYQPKDASGQSQITWPSDWAKSLTHHLINTAHQEPIFDQYKAIFERVMAQTVLSQCNGNQSQAAKRLGVSRNTLARFLNPGKQK